MKKNIIGTLVALAVGTSMCAAQEGAPFRTVNSLPEIFAQAKKENKLVFIDCYFTGCHPCAQMDKEVYPNAVVAPELDKNFISVKIDVFSQKMGDTINMKYGISGYPTLLILNAEGKVVSRTSGYKDAGQFINLLTESKTLSSKKQFCNGFTTSFNESYPAFYAARYLERKVIDSAATNAYLQQNTNSWMQQNAALSIFLCGKTTAAVNEYVLNHAKEYNAAFGTELTSNKVVNLLIPQLAAAVGRKADAAAFEKFMTANSVRFPDEIWKACSQTLAERYYISYAKDTTGYISYMSKHPVLYQYYLTAFYGTLMSTKQLTKERSALMCLWADAVVDAEASLDIIRTTAFMHRNAGDEDGYKKYINMALAKINKYQMPGKEDMEKMLAAK